MIDCIFCKIIKGDIPALKVYEDSKVIAFLDITPISVGHTLVVPKAHYPDLSATADEVLGPLFAAVKKVAKAAVEATGAHGFNVGVNTGPAAGQVVMHTHVHVMPRTQGDGLTHWPKRAVTEEQMAATAEAMSRRLA